MLQNTIEYSGIGSRDMSAKQICCVWKRKECGSLVERVAKLACPPWVGCSGWHWSSSSLCNAILGHLCQKNQVGMLYVCCAFLPPRLPVALTQLMVFNQSWQEEGSYRCCGAVCPICLEQEAATRVCVVASVHRSVGQHSITVSDGSGKCSYEWLQHFFFLWWQTATSPPAPFVDDWTGWS